MSRYVLVVRHGERADDVGAAKDGAPQGDPALTEAGKANIQGLVDDLKSTIQAAAAAAAGSPAGATVAQFEVFSSPFLRCRQTANGMVQRGVGKEKTVSADIEPSGTPGASDGSGGKEAKVITVDDDLSEVFGPVRIKTTTAPMPWQQNSIGTRPLWPESIEDARDRFRAALVKHLEEEPASHICLVTHGDALDAVYTLLFPNRILYEASYLSYLLLEVPVLPPLSTDVPPFTGPLKVNIVKESGIQWMEGGDGDDGDVASTQPKPIMMGALSQLNKKRVSKAAASMPRVDRVHHKVAAVQHGNIVATEPLYGRVVSTSGTTNGSPHTAVPIPSNGQPMRRGSPKTPTSAQQQQNQHHHVSFQHTSEVDIPGSSYHRSSGLGSQNRERNFYLANYGCRIGGILSTLLLLMTDPVPPVVLLSSCVTVLEVLTTFIRPFYEMCPSAPPTARWRSPAHHTSGAGSGDNGSDESDSLIDPALNQNSNQGFSAIFKLPLIAGVTKFLLASLIFLLLSYVVFSKGHTMDVPRHLVTTWQGILCVVLYLGFDTIRVWKK